MYQQILEFLFKSSDGILLRWGYALFYCTLGFFLLTFALLAVGSATRLVLDSRFDDPLSCDRYLNRWLAWFSPAKRLGLAFLIIGAFTPVWFNFETRAQARQIEKFLVKANDPCYRVDASVSADVPEGVKLTLYKIGVFSLSRDSGAPERVDLSIVLSSRDIQGIEKIYRTFYPEGTALN